MDLTRDAFGYAVGNPLQLIDPLGLRGWNPLKWTADEWSTIGTVAAVVGTTAAVAAMWVTPIGPIATGIVVAANVVGGAASAAEITRSCFMGDSTSSCGSAVAGAAVGLVTMGIGAGVTKAGVGIGGSISAGAVKSEVDGVVRYPGRHVDRLSSILAREVASGVEIASLYATECLV